MNILLLSAAPLGLKVLHCLHGEVDRVDILADSSDNIARGSRFCSTFHHMPFHEAGAPSKATIAWINDHIEQADIDVLLADDMPTNAFLHEIRDHIHKASCFAPGNADQIVRLHDKWMFYQACREVDLPIPTSALLRRPADLSAELVAEVGFPLLIKPLNAEGGAGIRHFDDMPSLKAAIEAIDEDAFQPLLLQQFIDGRDIGFSVLVVDGTIIAADAQWTPFDDTGIRRYCDEPELRRLAEDIITRLNFNGVANFDMRWDDQTGQLYVLECNPRFFQTVIASKWMGVNFPHLAALAALGEPMPPEKRQLGLYMTPGSLIRSLKSPKKLRNISGGSVRHLATAFSDPLPQILDAVYKRWP